MLTPQALFKLVHQVTPLLIENRLINCARALGYHTIGPVAYRCLIIFVAFTMVHSTETMDKKADGHTGRRFIVRDTDDGWYMVDAYSPKNKKECVLLATDPAGVSQPSNPYDKVSRVLRQADEFLDAARAGTFDKPVDPLLMRLQKSQRLLFALMRRTSPTFVQEVIDAHQKNVASVGLNPKQAYEYFGLSAHEGQDIPYSYFKKLIKCTRSNPATPQKKKDELRQLEYVFANGPAMQEYRAYLKGRAELAKLMLKKQEAEHVKTQLNQVIQYTLVIQAVRTDLSAVAKAIPAHISQERLI